MKSKNPSEFWNSMTPAARLEFIKKQEIATGKSIGHSNAKCSYSKLTNKELILLVNHSALISAIKNAPVVKVEKTSTKSSEMKSTFTKDGTVKDLWNPLKPSVRLEYIKSVESRTGKKIGHSNADLRFEKLTNKTLIDSLLSAHERIVSDVKSIINKMDLKVAEEVTPVETESVINEVSDELDLCISFDDTGSMYSVRSQVRTNINYLVDKLFVDIPKIRIGIIIHNDYCDMPRHIFTLDFTNDIDKIKKFVNQSSPCGGGDAPECYELALHEASKMSWQSDRRALVLIGDEVPHQVGYYYGGHTNKIDWKDETAALAAMDVKIYGVQALGRRSSTSFYEYISRTTGGIKLDLSQFQHISTYINAIAYHQAGQLDTYQSSDPSFNTNIALKNMFNKLKGGSSMLSADKIELLSKFQVMNVEFMQPIKDFVEANGCTFRRGKGYYSLIARTEDGKANSEIIQANKEVIMIDKETGEAYNDTEWCREKLGIPYGIKGTIRPLSIPDIMDKYEVFIQSNSYNRNLDKGTRFLYELDHI